jgi:hypothetical protein
MLWGEAAAQDEVAASPQGFRLSSSISSAGLSDTDADVLSVELRDLERVGLLVEADTLDPTLSHVYVPPPAEADEWSIGIYGGPSPLSLSSVPGVTNPVLTGNDVTDLAATYVADPFMLEDAGRWHMFFEVVGWHDDRGRIGHATSNDCLRWKYEGIVLDETFHVSYPYVFEWAGEKYMVPETYAAGGVWLYRAAKFPSGWVATSTVVEGPCLVDPSVVRVDETWWLFVGAGSEKQQDMLLLFYAENLTGPWREHPRSPIVSGDAHISRPAGRLTSAEGRLLRFTQRCTPEYGLDVRAFEVTRLTRSEYEERPAAPTPIVAGSGEGWNASGMHHIDAHELADGWIAAVDGWRRHPEAWPDVRHAKHVADARRLARDIEAVVPEGELVLLIAKGLELEVRAGRQCLPFPEQGGEWGGYPADDAAAIAELERLRSLGGQFLVVPAAMSYWLETYPGLAEHLRERAVVRVDNERALIFELGNDLQR